MKDQHPNWRNKPYSLDVQYTESSQVPLLTKLIKKYKRFWDGEFWYRLTKLGYVWRWPDWRKNYNIPMEKPK